MPNSLQQAADASASSEISGGCQSQLCRMVLSSNALPQITVCILILVTAGALCEIVAMQLIMLQWLCLTCFRHFASQMLR